MIVILVPFYMSSSVLPDKDSRPPLCMEHTFQDPQCIPENTILPNPIYTMLFLYIFTISLKESTSQLLCGTSELLASLRLHVRAIIK